MRAVRLLTVAVLALAAAPAGAVGDPAARVSGQWANPPCVTTSARPGGSPFELHATCTGVGAFLGAWRGPFVVTVTEATVDVVSGATHARADVALAVEDQHGGRGTVRLREVIRIDPDGLFRGYARILRGSGALAGATGCLSFTGIAPGASAAIGDYEGVWARAGERSAAVRGCRPLPRRL